MKKVALSNLFCLIALQVLTTQNLAPVEVTVQALKVGSNSEEALYYGFAAGDVLLFDFDEANEKAVKEVEIVEMPSNSKYLGYEVKAVKEKRLTVNRTAVYKFRFFNDANFKGRVCRVKIQRIPASPETAKFNSSVKWVEKFDTAYEVETKTVPAGYQTITKEKTRRVLASVDTSVQVITDRVERVHSKLYGPGGQNSSVIAIPIPENKYEPFFILPKKATELLSWAYTISVGDSGTTWYKDANQKAAAKSATKLAASAGLIPPQYVAMSIFAIEALSAFSNPPKGENIQYQFFKGQVPTSQFGDAVAVCGRVTETNPGPLYLKLTNDNIKDGINVDVKVIAVTVTKTWKEEPYTVTEQEPIKEKKVIKTPKVTVSKVPVVDSQ